MRLTIFCHTITIIHTWRGQHCVKDGHRQRVSTFRSAPPSPSTPSVNRKIAQAALCVRCASSIAQADCRPSRILVPPPACREAQACPTRDLFASVMRSNLCITYALRHDRGGERDNGDEDEQRTHRSALQHLLSKAMTPMRSKGVSSLRTYSTGITITSSSINMPVQHHITFPTYLHAGGCQACYLPP